MNTFLTSLLVLTILALLGGLIWLITALIPGYQALGTNSISDSVKKLLLGE